MKLPPFKKLVVKEIKKYNWNDRVAQAVFTGESGLNARAVSPTGDYGIAQINMRTWNGHYGLNYKNVFNYKKNISVAYQIYKNRGNFSAWTVYNSGAYRRYL